MEVTWRCKRRSSVGRRKKEAVSGVSPLSSDPWPISLHLMGATCSLSSPPYPWIRQLQPFSLSTWWVPVPLHHLCAQSKQTEGRAAYPPVAVSSHAFTSIIIITESLLGKYHVDITVPCIVPFICLAFHVRNHDDYLLTSYYHNKHYFFGSVNSGRSLEADICTVRTLQWGSAQGPPDSTRCRQDLRAILMIGTPSSQSWTQVSTSV